MRLLFIHAYSTSEPASCHLRLAASDVHRFLASWLPSKRICNLCQQKPCSQALAQLSRRLQYWDVTDEVFELIKHCLGANWGAGHANCPCCPPPAAQSRRSMSKHEIENKLHIFHWAKELQIHLKPNYKNLHFCYTLCTVSIAHMMAGQFNQPYIAIIWKSIFAYTTFLQYETLHSYTHPCIAQ